MRKLLLAAALAFAAQPAFAQLVISPSQMGAVGSVVTATDPNGNSKKVVEPHIICDSGCGGSGGGGAVTAASGSYVAGAIVDLGTGATPAAYTTNSYLKSLAAGVTVTSGTVTLGAGSAAIGSISNTSFAATQATAANLNATVVGTGTFAVQATGNVGGYDTVPSVTPTVQASAYATGNALGGTQTLTLARTNGGSGIITALMLQSKGGATNTVWIYAFQKSPASTCTDKTAFSLSSSDRPYLVPGFPQSVTLASPGSWDAASYASVLNLTSNFKNQDTTPGQSIYFCLVTAAAVTPASTTDLIFTVGLPQD